MEANWNHLIERYLQGELSPDGIEAFEHELSINPDLQMEFELHNLINESVARSIQRQSIQQLGAKYHFKMKMKKWLSYTSAVSGATAATLLTIYMTSGSPKENLPVMTQKAPIDQQESAPVNDNLVQGNDSLTHEAVLLPRIAEDENEKYEFQSVSQNKKGTTETVKDIIMAEIPEKPLKIDDVLKETKDSPSIIQEPVKKSTKADKIAEQNAKSAEVKKIDKIENAKFVLSSGFDNPLKVEAVYLNSFDLPFFTYDYGNMKIFTDKDNYLFYNKDNNSMIVLPKRKEGTVRIVTTTKTISTDGQGKTRIM